jgi:hypothetical protein
MKISELLVLLENNKSGSILPTAASLLDRDSENDQDPEDSDSKVDDQDSEADSDYSKEFRGEATDFGKDLFVMGLFNYGRDFSDARKKGSAAGVLRDIDDPVVKDYLNQGDSTVLDNHTVSAVFMNGRNDKFFALYAGRDGVEWAPAGDLTDLSTSGLIDPDQTAVLLGVNDRAERYSDHLKTSGWRGGRNGSDTDIDLFSSLLDKLKLDRVTADSLGLAPTLSSEEWDERQKAHQETLKRIEARRAERRKLNKK